ncbi:MAG TPA: hypothetical protein VGL10_01985 [Gammaproteobacteria bacterium]
MKKLFTLTLSVLLFGCTTVPPKSMNANPPKWDHIGQISYESKFPGLGIANKYKSPEGVIDVYVYDLQRGMWKDGVDDSAFADHFLSTIDEVKYFAQKGTYGELQIGSITDISIAGQKFRSVSFRFLREGQQMESFTFLTAINGKLLKYRMSFFVPASFDLQLESRKFVEADIHHYQKST